MAVRETSFAAVVPGIGTGWSRAFTVAGSNPVLVVVAQLKDAAATVALVSWSLGSGTPVQVATIRSANGALVTIWVIPAPVSGTGNVTVTHSASVPYNGGVTLMTNADQTTPGGAASTSTTNTSPLTLTPASLAAADATVGAAANATGNWTSATPNQRLNDNVSTVGSLIGDATGTTGVTFTSSGLGVGDVALAAIRIIAAGASPDISAVSSATPAEGSTLTLTGTGFGATQGAGSVKIGGVAQTVTSWATTSVDITVAKGSGVGSLKNGTAYNVVLTENGGGISAFALTSVQPQSGWSFVDVVTPNTNAALRLQGMGDMSLGDQIEWDTVSTLVVVNSDGSFAAYPSVGSFNARLWDPSGGWGAQALQRVQSLWPTYRSIKTPDLGLMGDGRIPNSALTTAKGWF